MSWPGSGGFSRKLSLPVSAKAAVRDLWRSGHRAISVLRWSVLMEVCKHPLLLPGFLPGLLLGAFKVSMQKSFPALVTTKQPRPAENAFDRTKMQEGCEKCQN